ncbi:MAG: YggS family pyridoxal phosphate-dependent enzyme [Aquihabitans sp.]
MPEQPQPIAPRFPTCTSAEELRANLAEVQDRIAAAAERGNRDPSDVRLLPVTKTMGDDPITWLCETGITTVGENKVQEAQAKAELFGHLDASWAMIGHLQSNKIGHVVDTAVELHSLDRTSLASRLDRRLQADGRSLDVFIQVNSSGEASKYGLAPEEVLAFAREVEAMDSLQVRGLMTLAVFSDDHQLVRRCFETMVELRRSLQQEMPDPESYGELSMGMSGDYELAIEMGATTVRVGQAIFGARSLGSDHYWPTPTGG